MSESLKSRLTGCVYTIYTPFDEEENIDFEVLEKYINHIYTSGGKIFYVMAYNSRYSQLTHEEILELNEFCIRLVKKLDPNNIIIVGDPIHCSTKETIKFAFHAKDAGADLISLLVREKLFSDDQIIDHYAQIGRQTKFNILVHEMPFISGYDGNQLHWPKTLLANLVKVPEIIALKEDAKHFELTCDALKLEPHIRVIIAGTKSAFIRFKKYGARAYLNGISMIDARIGEAFWQAYTSGDDMIISEIINKLETPFFEKCVEKYGWHRVNKALLEAAGLMNRRERMPLKHLSDEEFKDVLNVYSEVEAARKVMFA